MGSKYFVAPERSVHTPLNVTRVRSRHKSPKIYKCQESKISTFILIALSDNM